MLDVGVLGGEGEGGGLLEGDVLAVGGVGGGGL